MSRLHEDACWALAQRHVHLIKLHRLQRSPATPTKSRAHSSDRSHPAHSTAAAAASHAAIVQRTAPGCVPITGNRRRHESQRVQPEHFQESRMRVLQQEV